jgi:Zn-dependent peptidase ImmA (M78 family)
LDASTAARRLGVGYARLRAWDAGEAQLTMSQQEKAAEAYKRPLAAFFLPDPPEEFEVVRDFRRLPGAPAAPSPELITDLRKAAARREIALELFEELDEQLPVLKLRSEPSESYKDAAARTREALGVTIDQQRSWRDAYGALRAWRAAVEAHGVLVFQITGVEVRETRGFSTFYDRLPVVAINGKDAPTARCFTLMHELGHLLTRRGAVCDLQDRDDSEIWCNAFAGEVLVPSDDLRKAIAGLPHREEWPDHELTKLSRRFWVSAEALLRRLVSIRLASQEFYKRWRAKHREVKYEGGGPVHRAEPGHRARRPCVCKPCARRLPR